MKRILVGIMVGLLAFVGSVQANSVDEAQAVEVAGVWLQLIDSSEYAESWEQTATHFQRVVPKSQWLNLIRASTKTVGKVESRTLISKQYMKDIPSAPEGEFVLIQYAAKLTNGKDAIETITPMKDDDGVWRVSGYYINPQ